MAAFGRLVAFSWPFRRCDGGPDGSSGVAVDGSSA